MQKNDPYAAMRFKEFKESLRNALFKGDLETIARMPHITPYS